MVSVLHTAQSTDLEVFNQFPYEQKIQSLVSFMVHSNISKTELHEISDLESLGVSLEEISGFLKKTSTVHQAAEERIFTVFLNLKFHPELVAACYRDQGFKYFKKNFDCNGNNKHGPCPMPKDHQQALRDQHGDN